MWPPPLSPVNLVLSRSPSLRQRQESLQHAVSLPSRQPTVRNTPRHSRAPSAMQLPGPADKAVPVPDQSHMSSQPSRAFSGGGDLQGQPSSLSIASEAETLQTFRDGSTNRGTVKGKVGKMSKEGVRYMLHGRYAITESPRWCCNNGNGSGMLPQWLHFD